MAWNRVIGQAHIKNVLQRLNETGKLPHAMLFYGPRGAGQDTMALEMAKVLNCEQGLTSACDTCTSCRQFNELRHPMLKLVFPLPVKPGEDSALEKLTPQELQEVNEQISLKAENPYHDIVISKASVIKVSSIRDIVRESSYRAKGKGRTVVVILDAEKMNQNAANALLKSLEEPTGDLMFILCTSNREVLLPTIKSRCQQFRFEPLTADEVMNGLRNEGVFDEEKVNIASQLCSGSYSIARQIAGESSGLDRTAVLDYLRIVVMNRPVEIMKFIADLTNNAEKQQVAYFLSLVQFWFRDITAIQSGLQERVFNVDMLDSMQKFADHYPDVDCASAVEMIDETIEMINKNVHLINALVVLSIKLRQVVVRNTA